MRYRAAPASALLVQPLDSFTAVFHRASGITHLLAEPAPEILAVLSDETLTLDDVLARLGDRYEMLDADPSALAARLEELVAAGLVEDLA